MRDLHERPGEIRGKIKKNICAGGGPKGFFRPASACQKTQIEVFPGGTHVGKKSFCFAECAVWGTPAGRKFDLPGYTPVRSNSGVYSSLAEESS